MLLSGPCLEADFTRRKFERCPRCPFSEWPTIRTSYINFPESDFGATSNEIPVTAASEHHAISGRNLHDRPGRSESLLELGHQAEGPGMVRVWTKVYSPRSLSVAGSSTDIKRATIQPFGAALA